MSQLGQAKALWAASLPQVSPEAPLQLFEKFLSSYLPKSDLYKPAPRDEKFAAFLGDATGASFWPEAARLAMMYTIATKPGVVAEENSPKLSAFVPWIEAYWRVMSKELSPSGEAAWPADYMTRHVNEVVRVLDDCHLFCHIDGLDSKLKPIAERKIPRADAERQFQGFRSLILSDRVVVPLTLYIGTSDALPKLQRSIYRFYIKLGFLERAAHNKAEIGVDHGPTKVVPFPTGSRDLIPRTKATVLELCEKISICVPHADDTTKDQIQKIAQRMTSPESGFRFTSLVDNFLEEHSGTNKDLASWLGENQSNRLLMPSILCEHLGKVQSQIEAKFIEDCIEHFKPLIIGQLTENLRHVIELAQQVAQNRHTN